VTDERLEARLRDALQTVRRQSIEGVDVAEEPDDQLSELELARAAWSGRRTARPVLVAAAALLAVVVGIAAFVGRTEERDTSVTATRPGDGLTHAEAVDQVTAGCRRFSASAPATAAPFGTGTDPMPWLEQYLAAFDEALVALRSIDAGAPEDRAVLAKVQTTLERARQATEEARTAATAADETAAVRLVDRARSYELIAGFDLARWGAAECDARGVTQPTR
jgi:hypothetical protein